jgi:putative ABC transport system permease protein
MVSTTLAGLRAHARRMVATALAVVFGVSFVAGTLIFSDTARAGFFDTYSRVAKNVDAAVEPGGDASGLTAAQVAAVRGVPHVAAVDARIVRSLAMLDRRGRAISNFGRAGVVVSTDGDPRLRAYDVSGRVPSAPGEAMLDKETAAHQRLAAGDQLTVLDKAGARHRYTLVGLIDFGTSKRFSDRSVVGLPTAEITALTGGGEYDEIAVRGSDGVSQRALVNELRAALGAGPQVITGDQRRIDLANDATQVADQFRFILLIFGVISLIVAAFVIYNTFAILLAQRVRETALLRCVGATRRQVLGSVLLESVAIGLAGGAAGVLLGIGVAAGLLRLLNGVVHAGVPAHGIVLGASPAVAGLAIGLLVTVFSASVPALRATRTSPLAALRDLPTARSASRPARAFRVAAGVLVGAAGIGITVLGTGQPDPQTGTFTIVAGGLVMFLAVLIFAPLFVGGLVTVLGTGFRWLMGTPAKLATANARRNPGRTAVTTATLMIGIGLMSLFSVLVASVNATASAQLGEHYPADYVVSGIRYSDGSQARIPAGYVQSLRGRREFSAVGEEREEFLRIRNKAAQVGAFDPASLGTLVKPQTVTGSLAQLKPGTVIVASNRQRLGSFRVGETIEVEVGRQAYPFTVVGSAPISVPGGEWLDALFTWEDLDRIVGAGEDTTVLAKAAPGVTPTASRDILDSLVDRYPTVLVNSVADLSSDLESTVHGLIALFTALVGTAVLIALFGIANTLSLSVVERTRESATVRALGLTRGQLRVTLLIEALLMGLVGALVGVVFGLVYGPLLVAKAFGRIHPTVVLPWDWLAGLVLLAAAAGTVAAVLPARRAARASIVAAMADT